ncbi:ribosomal protein S18-alanine N-acetyltransferase [bacterium]|nr:ribosomal protein S18-alanine N-acetyltransferase [bacterium]
MTPLSKIRPMRLRDLFWILQIENACFPSPWPKEEFITELTNNRFAKYFVAISDKRIIGFIGLWLIFEEAHVTTIAVLPNYQKMGIGKSLLSFGEKLAQASNCTKMILEVRESNKNAYQFYLNEGYKFNRIKKNYYTHNLEDGIEMIKELNHAAHSGS